MPEHNPAWPLAAATAASLTLGYVFNRLIADPYVATVVRMEALAAGDLERPRPLHHPQGTASAA